MWYCRPAAGCVTDDNDNDVDNVRRFLGNDDLMMLTMSWYYVFAINAFDLCAFYTKIIFDKKWRCNMQVQVWYKNQYWLYSAPKIMRIMKKKNSSLFLKESFIETLHT